MNYDPRRFLTAHASRKRKEREVLFPVKPSAPGVSLPPQPTPPSVTSATAATQSEAATEPVSSNRILAGYMAYEFLTRGTLLGQKWDPARAEALPVSCSGSDEPKRTKPGGNGSSHAAEGEPSRRWKQRQHEQSYSDVASLLKDDGAHVPGVVNPTQLARWIQM